METRDRKRVVLRANGKRRHLEVSAGAGDRETSRGSERAAHILSDTATPPCRPAQQTHHSDTCSQPSHSLCSPPTPAAAAARERSSKIFHSTPLHLPPTPHWRADLRQTRPPQFPSFRDSTSSSSSSSLADAPREQPISGDQMLNKAQKLHTSSSSVGKPVSGASTQKGRLGQDMRASSKTRQRRKKRSRVHPEPQASVDSSPQVHAPSPPIPPAWSPQSSSYSVPEQPALDCSGALNCSLPPLLSARLRKGGRRPSASVDWSSDGAAELRRCLPDQQLRVFVGTWNMQELSDLPDSVDPFLLPTSHEVASELYVVGTQESTSQRRDWEVLLQQTLGPSHVLVHSASLGVLYLLIFLRRDLLWFCSEVQSAGHATRPGKMIRTKGGVGISFSLFGTSFLFITSHLTAHQHKVTERNSDMHKIADNLTSSGLGGFDYVFWLGDLNYRVDMDRAEVDRHLQQQQQQQGWMPLLLHDQLTKEILRGNVFQGFSEQPIQFPPSYKFDPHSDTYDSSERRRVPSWTDRILFHSRAGSGVSGCGYDSCQSLQCSDHRPVYGVFRVRLEPCWETDGIPAAMAGFDREVYRIAQHRRREVARLCQSLRESVDGPTDSYRTSRHVTSSVCTLL